MFLRRITTILAVLASLLTPSSLAAQTSDQSLGEILLELYIRPFLLVQGINPERATDAQVQRTIDQLSSAVAVNQLIVNQLATFPLGTSSGGFSYTFDPEIGTFTRRSQSFGPAYAERALTIGQHKLSVGGYYQHVTFDRIEGKRLDNGELQFFTPFRRQGFDFVLGNYLKLKLVTDTVALFATYGITNSIDLGVAVPITRVQLDARTDSTLFSPPDLSLPSVTTSRSGTSSGVGDVIIRGKYNFMKLPGGGLAAGVDLRLPTGDDTNLRGTGSLQNKIYFILSTAYERTSPHVNVGFTKTKQRATDDSNSLLSVQRSQAVPDEFNVTGGVDFAATRRTTISGDLLIRRLINAGRLKETPFTVQGQTFRELQLSDGTAAPTYAAIGVKVNVWRTLLVSANVLVPVTKAGIYDQWTPAVGFDWAF